MHRARTMMPLAPHARVVPRTTGPLKSRAVECHGFASTEIIQGRPLVGIICEGLRPKRYGQSQPDILGHDDISDLMENPPRVA